MACWNHFPRLLAKQSWWVFFFVCIKSWQPSSSLYLFPCPGYLLSYDWTGVAWGPLSSLSIAGLPRRWIHLRSCTVPLCKWIHGSLSDNVASGLLLSLAFSGSALRFARDISPFPTFLVPLQWLGFRSSSYFCIGTLTRELGYISGLKSRMIFLGVLHSDTLKRFFGDHLRISLRVRHHPRGLSTLCGSSSRLQRPRRVLRLQVRLLRPRPVWSLSGNSSAATTTPAFTSTTTLSTITTTVNTTPAVTTTAFTTTTTTTSTTTTASTNTPSTTATTTTTTGTNANRNSRHLRAKHHLMQM